VFKRKNPFCPHCGSDKTIKKGSQRDRKRFFCESCLRSFSVFHGRKRPVFWIPHIDGVPFRKLGDEFELSGTEAYKIVMSEFDELPDNSDLTAKYSDPKKFSGILVLDGKFVKVAEYEHRIPFIYGIDYLTHDIPVGILAKSESHIAFTQLFEQLKKCNYPLKVVVCDDRLTVGTALKKAYPFAKIQLCQNHYLENIRRFISFRTDEKYHHFFASLQLHVFSEPLSGQQIIEALRYMLDTYGKNDEKVRAIIHDINNRKEQLFQYVNIPNCPKDTNLVELYNSHMQARLKSIKGFQNFKTAQRWLNAYLIRRRTKTLTDCEFKFKHLNGYPPLHWSIKDGMSWPKIPGVIPPGQSKKIEDPPTVNFLVRDLLNGGLDKQKNPNLTS
jgi:hypothetical protein